MLAGADVGTETRPGDDGLAHCDNECGFTLSKLMLHCTCSCGVHRLRLAPAEVIGSGLFL